MGGYVLPMVVGVVLAISSVTAMLVAAVGNVSRTARIDARRLLEIISLESATLQTAALLAAGAERPFRPVAEQDRRFNDITISTVISPPEGKFDVNADSPQQIRVRLQSDGISSALSSRVLDALSLSDGLRQDGLVRSMYGFSRAAALSFEEEDCLRRELTVGRWPARYFEGGSFHAVSEAKPEDEEPSAIRPGEQIDIRSSLTREDERRRVLWARIRVTGDFEQPSLTHDWAFLMYRPEANCPIELPKPAA
jgi:hypothetical protein